LLEKYDKFLNILQKVTLSIAATILALMLLINFANIFANIFAARRFNWAIEISLILFVYSVMLTIPALYKSNELLVMDIISQSKSGNLRSLKKYLSFFIELLIFIFLVALLYSAIKLSWNQRDLLSRGMRIPRSVTTFPVVLSSFLMLLVSIFKLITNFKIFKIRKDCKKW